MNNNASLSSDSKGRITSANEPISGLFKKSFSKCINFLSKMFGRQKKTVIVAAVIPALLILLLIGMAARNSHPEEMAVTVDASSISLLDIYESDVKLDLSGSTCYPEIEDYINNHPGVDVHYTVDLGGYSAESSSEKLTLGPEDYSFAFLRDNLRYLPNLKLLSLPGCPLSSSEINELKKNHPGLDIEFSCNIGGNKDVSSSEHRITLYPEEYSFERLLEFLKAANV